jgi:hypothetical protein
VKPLTPAAALLAASLLMAGCSVFTPKPATPVQTTSVPTPHAVVAPTLKLGIDIDFYATPGTKITATARQDIAYIKHLQANAVSISFPYYTNPSGTVVHALPSTPSMAQLTTLVGVAEQAGLAVTLRPLLNETGLEGVTRPHWRPASLTSWFTAYKRFLLAYARLAQADHVTTFVIGTEFTRFNRVPLWDALAAAIRTVYRGQVAYDNNWGTPRNHAPGITQTLDAYRPVQLPTSAPLGALETAWTAWTRTLPRSLVLSEVGVDPQPGVYNHPWLWNVPGQPIIPEIQAKWFAAACHAVAKAHLGGIYFWPLYFGQRLTTPLGVKAPTAFAGTTGAAAIARCFTALRGIA